MNKYIAFGCAIPVAIWQLCTVFIPLIILLGKGLILSGTGDFSSILQWAISKPILMITFRSFAYSFLVTMLSLIIGYPIAYIISRSSEIHQKLALSFICIPFLTNFLLHVASWSILLNPNGYINKALSLIGFQNTLSILYSSSATILLMLYCYLPFMIISIYLSLTKIHKNILEASYDLGATWKKTVLNICIPMTREGILSGVFLIFIPAAAEFIIPELIGGDVYMYVGSLLSYLTLSSSMLKHSAILTILFALALGVGSWLMYVFVNILITRKTDT